MNALPSDLVRQTQELSEHVTRPIPGSRKIHVTGSRDDLRVPLREVALADTPLVFGAEKNAPVTVYDTSGPYTDPDYRIDLSAGLPPLRARWIAERGDVEQLAGLSSEFGRRREADRRLAAVSARSARARRYTDDLEPVAAPPGAFSAPRLTGVRESPQAPSQRLLAARGSFPPRNHGPALPCRERASD